jgi:CBS-domain-containing membrane protein
MGKNQVRRLPVLNREKRLVGIVSLGDLSQTGPKEVTGMALAAISQKMTY